MLLPLALSICILLSACVCVSELVASPVASRKALFNCNRLADSLCVGRVGDYLRSELVAALASAPISNKM